MKKFFIAALFDWGPQILGVVEAESAADASRLLDLRPCILAGTYEVTNDLKAYGLKAISLVERLKPEEEIINNRNGFVTAVIAFHAKPR